MRIEVPVADAPLVLQLSPDEALVLFEFLARFSHDERLEIADPAEELVLWGVFGQLERALVAPLAPDYVARLAAARGRLRDPAD